MSKVELNGSKAERIWSINLGSAQFNVALLLGVIALVTALWAGVSTAGGWMAEAADERFHECLERELAPPGGDVYRAIDAAITAHERHSEQLYQSDYQALQLRLTRLEILISEMYTEYTGRPIPRLPGD